MASSSNSEFLEDETSSSELNGGEQKQTVIGVGGIGRNKIINRNSKFEFHITENKYYPTSSRSRKGKRKAEEFDSFSEEGRFVVGVAAAAPPQIRFTNNGTEIDFESRRSVFNEILDAIKDDGFEMIGIWGMPGIGKTVLVKRVGKYARDEGLFKVVAMAAVSQNPSVKAIQDEIADAIPMKFTSESIPGRANELHQRLLAGKKILVILDDIWDSIELNEVGIPSGIQHKGCKVILTSRIEDVCKQMRTGKNFKIDVLSANEALDLFLQMSGVDNNRSSEEWRLAEELSEECGRLPLAIVIVARELLNKEPNDWADMLNRLRNSDLHDKVRAAIELSFNKVEREEEKKFFLLCALFPEDYAIPVRVLFEYGIGLELFEKVNNMDQARVRAHKLASSLKSSCLLLDAGRNENWELVKMHDVVRDAALAIASEGEHAFLVTSEPQWREWPKKTAISMWSVHVEKLPVPDALNCPRLKILILDCRYSEWQFGDNFFTGMKNLIVLDMWGMKCVRLPQSFAGLVNLQTLRLISCKLGDVSAIGKLQNLVSLSFSGSDIEELPKEVGELSNLRFLDLSCCLSLKVIRPGVIQNLSQLQVLLMGKIDFNLTELIHLSRLMILEICIANASMLPEEVLFENLTKFKISIGGDYFKIHKTSCWSSQKLKLKSISVNELTKAGIKMLMKKAQHLEMEDVSGISVALPSHLDGVSTLKELFVSGCEDVNYILDINERDQLHLVNLPLLKEITTGKFPCMFVSKLEHLKLHKLPSLVRLWPFQAQLVALAYLTTMEVESCNELKYIFEQSTAKSLLKLRKLVVGDCRNLQAIYLTKEEEHDHVIVFPQQSYLELSELENLTSFGSKFTSDSTLFVKQVIFSALEMIRINNLEKLEKIWHIHTSAESFFQLKVLNLTQCPELLTVFPPQATSALRNLETISIKDCDKLETLVQSDDIPLTVVDETILFPQLLVLELINLPKFRAILSTTSQNIFQTTVIFSAMEILTLCRLHNLDSTFDQQLLTFFPKLKKLQLFGVGRLPSTVDQLHINKGLEALEELIIEDNSGQTFPKAIAIRPKLRKLKFHLINEPIEWSEGLYRAKGFQNLTSLQFYYCNGLKSLLTPSAVSCLVQLEELFVNKCEIMESIVGETSTEQNFDNVIEFLKLHTLRIENLPCLTSFYNGECALKFPCLDDFSIECCSQLKTFTSMSRKTPKPSHQNFVPEALFGEQVSFGRLRCLKLKQMEVIEEIWHRNHLVTIVGELSNLEIICCDRLLTIFPSNLLAGLQNLKALEIRSCASLDRVFVVKHHPPFLSNLQLLALGNLPKLKQLWWNDNTCESFGGLPSFQTLIIITCPALQYVFDASVANHLEALSALYVVNCSSIVEIVEEKLGRKIMFPLLDTLNLENLPCFKVNQSVEFPKVDAVHVDRCFNMKDRYYYNVNVSLVRDLQLQGSMSFFESLVEYSKTVNTEQVED